MITSSSLVVSVWSRHYVIVTHCLSSSVQSCHHQPGVGDCGRRNYDPICWESKPNKCALFKAWNMSNIARHASSTARNVFRVLISIFPVHSLSFLPLHMSASPWYSYFLTVFWLTQFSVRTLRMKQVTLLIVTSDLSSFLLWVPTEQKLSLIHIWRCRRAVTCRSRWSPYH